MHVPFLDLKKQHHILQNDLTNSVLSAIAEGQFVKGTHVSKFEKEFAALVGSSNCISVGNGTDALFVSLKALNVQHQDEVITPSFSWISSAETISLCGAQPVFADVNPGTFTIDPVSVRKKITARTKGIIAVHLYGQAAQMPDIKKICQEHGLFLIEDCAQAHLTAEDGRYAGTFGDVGCFSFYPTKNLGAFGDAGCVVTNNAPLAEKIRRLANHGALQKDDHLFEGLNSRMDTIQAAVLLAKLPYLKKWNRERLETAQLYNRLLADVHNLKTPYIRPNTEHTFHLYVIRTKHRDRLKDFLRTNGVETIVHYPKALPNLDAYKHLGHAPADFPIASQLQDEVLSLPNYPGITQEEIHYVCEKIHDFYKKPH